MGQGSEAERARGWRQDWARVGGKKLQRLEARRQIVEVEGVQIYDRTGHGFEIGRRRDWRQNRHHIRTGG